MARNLQKGDTFVAVSSFDLAIALWTLEIPFFDPEQPFFFSEVANERKVKFNFEVKSPRGVLIKDLMAGWGNAHNIESLPSAIAIVKRTIWERRWYLTELAKNTNAAIPTLPSRKVKDVRLASIASALGFTKVEPQVYHINDDHYCLIADTSPTWLHKHGVTNLNELANMLIGDVDFITAPGNEDHPVAVALAAYINIVSWLDNFRHRAKPYHKFVTASGKPLWVKKDSPKYQDFLAAGYLPQ